jgi:hypothetical protein
MYGHSDVTVLNSIRGSLPLRGIAIAVLVVAVACSGKVKEYPEPSGAIPLGNLRYVPLVAGRGRAALDGEIWGVESTLVSHRERGCDYPCKRYLLYRRFSPQLEPWNALLRTMREGEIRRVWLKLPGRNEPVVFEIELASVIRTDARGEPIIDNR